MLIKTSPLGGTIEVSDLYQLASLLSDLPGYQLALSNTYPRSMASRLSERPSTLDFIPPSFHEKIKAKTITDSLSSYLQNAANAAESEKLWISSPPGLYPTDQTLEFSLGGGGLCGAGEGYGFLSGITTLQATASSRMKWIGAANGKMIHYTTLAGAQVSQGGGLQNWMIDGNGGLADTGVHLETWANGTFAKNLIYGCNLDGMLTGVVDHSLAAGTGDTQRNWIVGNTFSTFGGSGWYLTNTGRGLRLTGGTASLVGNTSINFILFNNAYTSKGIPFKLENCDDNILIGNNGSAFNDATVKGFELGSADQDSGTRGSHARYNILVFCLGTVHARAGQSGGLSSLGNLIIGHSRANVQALPTYETPAGGSLDPTAPYIDTNGNTRFNLLGLLDGITAPTAITGLAQQYIDTADGDLKERFGDNVTKLLSADT